MSHTPISQSMPPENKLINASALFFLNPIMVVVTKKPRKKPLLTPMSKAADFVFSHETMIYDSPASRSKGRQMAKEAHYIFPGA
jgi:hypothetical protein